jgi:hypothetical protein
MRMSGLCKVEMSGFIAGRGAGVPDKERRIMPTRLLQNTQLDQATVLSTSDEVLPSIVLQGMNLLSLAEGMKRDKILASRAA